VSRSAGADVLADGSGARAGYGILGMTKREAPTAPVRPRHAASLVLLREGARGPEVLMGRRGRTAPFMPGRYVCPGGRVVAADRQAWMGETGRPVHLDPAASLLRLPRAALRETFEESGVLVGRLVAAPLDTARPTAIEAAYAARGLAADLGLLAYIGRAITPTVSPMRFDTRFFVADARHAMGEPEDSTELDDVGWHTADPQADRSMSEVTRFMLTRALAVWRGACDAAPLYRYIANRPCIRPHRSKGQAGR
jgi:8-oxo-dGTP pyrophosphatase MutT (NUDIX family)